MRRDYDRTLSTDRRQPIGRRLVRQVRRTAGVLGLVAATGWLASGCTQGQLAGQSPAYLIIDSLEGGSGAKATQFSNSVQSDVETKGGVFEDPGQVIFRLALKDPGSTDSPSQPSPTNFITVTRYHVRYLRSDGRNTPGVNVPYPFDGGMTVTVNGSGATGTFVLVRVQAKLEAPLMGLRNLGSALAISTIAEVTFYGQDQAGREVSVAGQISVNFADWADAE